MSRPVLLPVAGAPRRGDKRPAADAALFLAGLSWAEGHTRPECGRLRYDPATRRLADPCGHLTFEVTEPARERTAAA